MGHVLLCEPVAQCQQIVGHGAERPDRLLRRAFRPLHDHARHHRLFVDIQYSVVPNRDRLAREREVDGVWRHDVLGRFERDLALLGDTDEHNTLGSVLPRSILSRDVILALATLELDDRAPDAARQMR